MVRDGAGQGVPSGLRTSPTGRVPQWVLDEAGGRPPAPVPWRAWEPSGPPTGPGRPRRLRRAIALALLLGLVGTVAVVDPLDLLAGRGAAPASASWPTPGIEAADAPLGTPPPAPVPGGAHTFTARQEDGVQPVAYDPCRPVHYVVRPDNAPAGGEAVVHEGFARLSEVTGLQFVFDGGTDESPSGDRVPFQPDRYGDRWAPVLVSWRTEAEVPEFLTDVVGLAGSAAVSRPGGPEVFVTGAVDLDAAAFGHLLADEAGTARARAIVLHELGHLVGLDHVTDPAQLMYPMTSTALDYAPGDLAGLAELGRGECVPEL
ncbi:matrixin family metalloprotease [Geodermatophilus sp. SYSU D00758]